MSPCVADLKLGTRSFEVNVVPEKAARQLSHIKGTTTLSHAIRCIDICRQVIQRWDRRQAARICDLHIPPAAVAQPIQGRAQGRHSQADPQSPALLGIRPHYPRRQQREWADVRQYHRLRIRVIDIAVEGCDPIDPAFDDNALNGIDSLMTLTSDRVNMTKIIR
jgi:hypothetical protein